MRTLVIAAFVLSAAGAMVFAEDRSPVWSNIPPAGYWMRMYPLRQYGAHWSLGLEVADFVAGRKKAMKIIEQGDGKYIVSPKLMASSEKYGYQQLSVRVEREKSQKIIDKLKKLGTVQSLIQRENLVPEISTDARSKLKRLLVEREAGKATIDRFGSIAAAIDELIDHLSSVDKTFSESENKILLNITIKTTEK